MNESKSIYAPQTQALPSVLDWTTWRARTIVLIGAATLVRFLFAATTGLTDTEAYYASWSYFPDLSYYDHPPLLAWVLTLAMLISKSAFAIRLVAILAAAISGAILYRFTARHFSPRAGYLAVLIITATPVFAFVSFLANPEAVVAPLWLLYLLLLSDLAEHRQWWRPILAGLVMGIAFDAKYTAILLLPVTLAYISILPRARHWWRRPALYAGGLVALLATLPVIIWNVQNGWPSITLHLVERMGPTQAFVKNAKHFFVGQFFFFHPLLFPMFMATMVMIIRRARRDQRFVLLALASAPVLLFFFGVMTRASDAESHWTLVSYLPLAMGVAVWLDERLDDLSRAWQTYARVVLAMSAGLALVFFCYTQTPELLRLLPPSIYDAQSDPVNETFGWDHLRAAINTRVAVLGPETVVVGSHNVICGHLLVALDDKPSVYCASPRRTEFDFVERRTPPKNLPFVYVDSARYPENVAALFPRRHCEDTPHLDIFRGGKLVNDYRMLLCAAED